MADEAIETKGIEPTSQPNEDVAVAIDASVSAQPSGTIEELSKYLGTSTDEAIGVALSRLKSADEANKRIVEIFENNPVAASILTTAAEKGDFFAGLAANLTPEEYSEQLSALIDGTPAFAAKQDRLKKLKEQEEKRANLQSAIDNSNQVFDKWVEDKGLTPEQVDVFEQTIRDIARIFEDMKITPVELDRLWLYADMDNVLSQSIADAEIAARNDEKNKKREKRITQSEVPIPEIREAGGDIAESIIPAELAELNAVVEHDRKRRTPFG